MLLRWLRTTLRLAVLNLPELCVLLIILMVTANITANAAVNSRTYIPEKAKLYLPIVKIEQSKYFPLISEPAYIPALIEVESCISLTHSRCWSPTSQLKTYREEGAGLGQITRAYKTDGSIRFDALQGMKDRYTEELKELSWTNVYKRPELQIRTIVLMLKDLDREFKPLIKDDANRLPFIDVSYNGGSRDTKRSRLACGLAKGCDPGIWFDHVERYTVKPSKPVPGYGGRSMRDINNEHARTVFRVRLAKYKAHYENTLQNPDTQPRNEILKE